MISYTLAKVTPDMSSPLMIQGTQGRKNGIASRFKREYVEESKA